MFGQEPCLCRRKPVPLWVILLLLLSWLCFRLFLAVVIVNVDIVKIFWQAYPEYASSRSRLLLRSWVRSHTFVGPGYVTSTPGSLNNARIGRKLFGFLRGGQGHNLMARTVAGSFSVFVW
ncbi:hypothetical protein F4774DRAFT_405048 [Daldinia eschscholtzii]|nr:hypothetical protein F4774DRAFT_405048 [Daldinia eschscholtzii]